MILEILVVNTHTAKHAQKHMLLVFMILNESHFYAVCYFFRRGNEELIETIFFSTRSLRT